MKPNATSTTHEPKQQTPPSSDRADDIAVSAAELVELIHSGNDQDVNEMVKRKLSDRHAA